MTRNDMIGGGCAVLALCLIAWLSLDSLDRAECQNVTADLTSPIDLTVSYEPNVSRCITKLNLQLDVKS